MAPSEEAEPLDASRGMEPGTLTALLRQIAEAPEEARGSAWEAALRPGTVVGRFELVREVGRGGFGIVWEARDRELGRPVAFKAVRAGDRAGLREERLLREAEAAARLSHPNIVTLFDAGRAEEGPFLVFELLQGRTLRHRLERGPLPVREAVPIALEVAKGVAHAHERGVVHRDLKPANVFLCHDGQVKVLDLGMAHAFGRRLADGGTPAYMAPEQALGAPEDERSDVFALGVMLFEMLSGKLPFAGRGSRLPGPAPLLEVPGAPALGRLVSRMLARDPLRRPRDGGEVAAALSALAAELNGAPAAPGRVRARRHGRLPALLAAGTFLGTAAAALVLLARGPSPGKAAPSPLPSIAVLAFADLSPQRDQEYLADGVAEEILTALSRVEGLRVAARTSSFYFKGRGEDLRTIGERLRVATVLEGSVRRSGERIRVSAQLVNVADGYRVWTETFDRNLTDIFAVQDEIAGAVAQQLRVRLAPPPGHAAEEPRGGVEAHASFLRGRHLARFGTANDLHRAIEAYERATTLDPAHARAHAGLGWALWRLSGLASDDTPWEKAWGEGARRGRASAERAVAAGPAVPDGYVLRAAIRMQADFDWAGAGADLDRARLLSPGDPEVDVEYGRLLAVQGRLQEAIAITQGALERDPLSPRAAWFMGMYYNATGRLDLARKVLLAAAQIAPAARGLTTQLCVMYLLAGKPAEAMALSARTDADEDLRCQAMAAHDLGRRRESDDALARLRRPSNDPYWIGHVHAWRGEVDQAFELLDRAADQRDPAMNYVKFDPLLRKIRGDPRYPLLLRKMNLPLD